MSGSVELASNARRASAFAADLLVALAAFLAPWIALDRIGGLTGEDWYWIGFIIGFLFFVSIPSLCLLASLAVLLAFFAPAAATGGRSLGEAIFGIAVAGQDGGPVTASQLLRREWARAWRLSLVVPGIADHSAARDDHARQAQHDRIARTVVMRLPGRPHVTAVALAAAAAAAAVTAGSLPGVVLGAVVRSSDSTTAEPVDAAVSDPMEELLPPGDYSSTPPRRPLFSLTLGRGWLERSETRNVVLEKATPPTGVLVFSENLARLSLEAAVRELPSALRVRSGAPAEIGGHAARRLLLDIKPGTYPSLPGWTATSLDSHALYLVRVGGETVTIVVAAPKDSFAAFAAEAERVLATIDFGSRL